MSPDERIDALERQVAALSAEVHVLRAAIRLPTPPPDIAPAPEDVVRERLRQSPGAKRATASADWFNAASAVSGEELESLVGRYGTLALAALVILMAVGAVIRMAVQRGLLTPEVRILAGVFVAIALAAGGLFFRARGERKYGGVLLALSLAVVDLVAWGAGPRFHLVPASLALGVVDVASVLLATLALHDDNEFLFGVALAGALSAPFVASDEQGSALALLSYGGMALASAVRSGRNAAWYRVFVVMVLGALVYALAAAALPVSAEWYGPFLVLLFAGVCALTALLLGATEWRSDLSRAFIAVGLIGSLVAIDVVGKRPFLLVLAVTVGFALLTHAALAVRDVPSRLWRLSALVLPLISLMVGAWATSGAMQAMVVAAWGAIALGSWQLERASGDSYRAGSHLLAAGVLGSIAVTSWLWGTPLAFVAGLAIWGAVQGWLGQREGSALPIIGVALANGGAALSAVDQLASRNAYGYSPFMTRSSASAACAALGLAIAGELVQRGRGGSAAIVNRPFKLGAVIGFLIVWGRMEVAHAFTPDLAAFLLTSYYAACGVGSIVAGRHFGIGRLRVAGLSLAIYAAVKALVEVTDISSLLLRVGAYAAVGVFLLGAGYLYRERGERVAEVMG